MYTYLLLMRVTIRIDTMLQIALESRSTSKNSPKAVDDTTATVGRYVVNRSHVTLSHTELTVLDKELTYVPTETKPNRQRYIQEFDNFARKLRLGLHTTRWRTTQTITHETQTTKTRKKTQTPLRRQPLTPTARHRSRDDPNGTTQNKQHRPQRIYRENAQSTNGSQTKTENIPKSHQRRTQRPRTTRQTR